MPGLPPIEPYAMPLPGELPAGTADWKATPERSVLLLHDLQEYFLRPLPAGLRAELVGNAAALRERCAAAGVPVAYTAQPGRMTEEQRGLLRDFWGPGMRTSEADRQVVPELAPGPADRVFVKWRYSAFVRSDLLDWMRGLGRDHLVLCGVYAHVGVLATAIEGFSHDLRVTLVADAVADFSRRHHRLALEYAAARCAVVRPAAEVLA